MREETERMLRRTLLEETKRNMKSAADAISNKQWNMAYRDLVKALGYVYDLDSNDEFFDSVIYAARGGEQDRDTDWDSYMEGDHDA